MAFESILESRIEKGLVCVKYGHTEKLKHCEIVEAAHPVPDTNGVAAARRILEMARQADARTLVINCISGGGSALLPCPADLCTNGCEIRISLGDIAKDIAGNDMFLPKPACVIVNGETVVTLRGNGKGGRNQEMGLAFLQNMSCWDGIRCRIHFPAASPDGNDGPTDAAGAYADAGIFHDFPELTERIDHYLTNNDSYHFHTNAGSIYRTGPTNTNVCDIQILLIR